MQTISGVYSYTRTQELYLCTDLRYLHFTLHAAFDLDCTTSGFQTLDIFTLQQLSDSCSYFTNEVFCLQPI